MNLYALDREKREKRLQAMMGDMGMALPDAPPPPPPEAFIERPLASDALPDALPGTPPGLDEPPCAPLPPDRGELLRALETLRETFEIARQEPLSALMVLADVERGVQVLRDGCLRLNLRSIADLLALLSATLQRTEPLNSAHMELLSLELEAARAMFRLGIDQVDSSAELLHALRVAARRQFNGVF
ncbi:hypothetical protein [Ferrovibrio sp.]|uniref:hypothetical protein n=1 Tax=Ferrovibrio sp. TaxID=1917215 RepID=UPI0035B31126